MGVYILFGRFDYFIFMYPYLHLLHKCKQINQRILKHRFHSELVFERDEYEDRKFSIIQTFVISKFDFVAVSSSTYFQSSSF